MERLIRLCLRRPWLVLALAALMALGGVTALWAIPVDVTPDISENQAIVLTEWHGRSPQEVENQITFPLSTWLQGVARVREIRGMSEQGMSMIYVVFDDGVDTYWARARVIERLQSARDVLPEGVRPVLGPDATPLGQIFWYTLDGPGYDLGRLRSLQDWVVRFALQAVPGVAEVASVGGFVPEYQVDVDPERLALHGVSLHDLVRAIASANVDVGGSTLQRGGMELVVRGVGSIRGQEDIERIVIGLRGEAPLLLGQIADVRLGPDTRRGALADENGERVGGVVTMRVGENPRELIERLKQAIDRLSPSLPPGVRIVPFYDRSQVVDETMGTLRDTVFQEILVTVAVILLFLLNLRVSLIVATTLPLGVLIAFVAMRAAGIDSNLMSLAGIAIAVGTMDDMGIVMSENIFAHLQRAEREESRLDLLARAAKEVSPAIVTSVAAMVVSFVPVFFLAGTAGKLFTPLAWTKTFCVVGSLVVAISVVPVLCHLFLKDATGLRADRPRWVRPFSVAVAAAGGFIIGFRLPALGLAPALRPVWPALLVALLFGAAAYRMTVERLVPVDENPVSRLIYRWYEPMLRRVLANKRRFAMVAGGVVCLGLLHLGGLRLFLLPLHGVAAALGGSLGRVEPFRTLEEKVPPIGEAFMPPLDEGSLLYMPSLLHQASLNETLEVTMRLNQRIREVPEVAQVMGKAGRAETALDPAPVGMIETVVNLRPVTQWRPGVTKESIVRELRDKTALIGVSPSWLQPIEARLIMLRSDLRASMALKIVGAPLHQGIAAHEDGARSDLQMHDSIERVSLALEKVVRRVPGATDVHALRVGGKPYLEIAVDQERAARFGVNARDVLDVIELVLGGKKLTFVLQGRERYPLRVQLARDLRVDSEELGRLLVPTASVAAPMPVMGLGHGGFGPPDSAESDGAAPVPLRWLVSMREVVGPAVIRTENGQLTGYVMFNAAEGGEEQAMAEALEAVERWRDAETQSAGSDPVPAGLRIEPAGRYLDKLEADRRLAVIVPLVLLINLGLLYLAFRRFGLTLAVFAAIPIAFAGGFIALWVYPIAAGTGPIHLTTAVWVGFIALFGICVDDGAVMGTYLVQRFDKQVPATVEEVRQAVVDAGLRRIRPCLMTTATTIFSLLPVLWSSGRGSDVMKPMALPLLGGLLVSLITLFTVPAVYSFIEERKLESPVIRR